MKITALALTAAAMTAAGAVGGCAPQVHMVPQYAYVDEARAKCIAAGYLSGQHNGMIWHPTVEPVARLDGEDDLQHCTRAVVDHGICFDDCSAPTRTYATAPAPTVPYVAPRTSSWDSYLAQQRHLNAMEDIAMAQRAQNDMMMMHEQQRRLDAFGYEQQRRLDACC